MRPLARLATCTLLLAGLAACSLVQSPEPSPSRPPVVAPRGTSPPPPSARPPGDAGGAPQQPPPGGAPAAGPREQHYEFGAATRALAAQATTQESSGDLEAAAATLERAVRIEPRNPLVWIELARLRLLMQSPREADGLARRALSLSTDDPRASASALRVLAQALKAQGRNDEAREAEQKAAAASP
jgi:tetratricopeptide (TPR) repeat protein